MGTVGADAVVLLQVLLRTSKSRRIRTRRLIICAGPWTNDVLDHLGARLYLEIWRVAWGHYKADAALHSRSPMWYHRGARGDLFYGFPPEESGELIAKAGSAFQLNCHFSCK